MVKNMPVRRRLAILIGLMTIVIGIGIFFASKYYITYKAATTNAQEQTFMPNELLVKFKSEQSDEKIREKVGKQLKKIDRSEKSIKKIKQLFKDTPKLSTTYKIEVALDEQPQSSIAKDAENKKSKQSQLDHLIDLLKEDGENIEYAEKNYFVKKQTVPNDPLYPNLWGMQKIQSADAWDQITDTGSLTIAVIDTGIDYNHPDIKDNILRDAGGKVVGYDFCNNDNDPMDDEGHGTHVAGTIAATGNNGLGVVGLNWRAKLMPVKFLCSDGGGTTENAALAIEWSVIHNAKISNNSWGGY